MSERRSRPRLIATDLDGTLVGSDGSITERTRRALAAAEAAGIHVVFVTGRPLRWAREVFEHVGGHGIAVVANGAVGWDVHADRSRWVRAFAAADLLGVAEVLRAGIPGTHFAVETLAGIALETGFQERYRVPEDSRRGTLAELVAEPVLKLLARHEELEPEEYFRRGRALVGERAEVTWSSTGALLEISAAGVTKASALAGLAAEYGIGARDVVAFGDMPNDLPMLRWAGTSYAMANAHPAVREAASALAPGNDEDGVAVVLERLLADR